MTFEQAAQLLAILGHIDLVLCLLVGTVMVGVITFSATAPWSKKP